MSGSQGEQRWRSHRVLSLVLRVLIALVPVVVGLSVGAGLARWLGRPDGLGATILWWGAVLSVTVLAVLGVERLSRRLLPLTLLLRLSLLFPDRAPSRFRVAMRASTVRSASRALAESEGSADPATQAEAALALIAALHAHDRLTRGHSERVRALTVMVGEEMGLERAELDRLEWAGLLHDIGKLRVPAEILNKAGPPDDDEWSVLRRHPGDGGVIMAPLSDWLGEWVHGVDGHHEYHDGTGYPLGLAGDEIALSGRIVAVTDALETMTAARSYKKPMPVDEARAELVACAGRQFDPKVVRAVLALSLPRLFFALGPVAAALQVPLVAPVTRTAIELQGIASVAVATAPRALASVALVLGTLGGGPAATVAGADANVTGVSVAEHAPNPTGAGSEAGDEVGASPRNTPARGAAPSGPTADEPDDAGGGGGAGIDDGDTPAAGRPDGPTGAPPGGTGADRPAGPGTPTPPTTTPVRPPPPSPPTTAAPPPPPPPPPTATPPGPNPPGLPAAALACLDGGWVGLGFPNQGQCLASFLPG